MFFTSIFCLNHEGDTSLAVLGFDDVNDFDDDGAGKLSFERQRLLMAFTRIGPFWHSRSFRTFKISFSPTE